MDSEAGVTVHFIDEGEDTGDIICQAAFPVEPGTPLPEFRRTAELKGVELLLKAIDDIEQGQVLARSQPRESPTPRARNVKSFKGLIDWNWPLIRIWHVLRGGWCVDSIAGLNRIEHLLELRIMDYEEREMAGYEPGRLYQDEEGRHFVACVRGRVFVRFRWSPRYLLRKLFLLH